MTFKNGAGLDIDLSDIKQDWEGNAILDSQDKVYFCNYINQAKIPSLHLLFQSQQWKQSIHVWNLFKVKIKTPVIKTIKALE